MLKSAGDIGFVIAATGCIAFAILFFTSVRWWKDYFGWVLAAVIGAAGVIMALSMIRFLGVPLPGIFWWRAIIFNVFGIGIWAGVGFFVWTQFFAPSIKKRKERS